MLCNPMEYLAAFGIVFLLGILTSVCFGRYIAKVKRDTLRTAQSRREPNPSNRGEMPNECYMP